MGSCVDETPTVAGFACRRDGDGGRDCLSARRRRHADATSTLEPMPELPKVPLILAPTPLHRLDRASKDTGLDLWIKRDDLTGFALGGNKGRKLEYLMAEALDQHAEVIVTCGASQSNFVRQLGAACTMLGLECAAAVMDLPYDAPAGKPEAVDTFREGGNVVADGLLGVDLRLYPDGDWESLFDSAEQIAVEYEAKGKRVYRVPIGGSSPLGAYSFYRAAEELEGFGRFDFIVVACSSGSTYTGLAYAFHGSPTRLVGISCDPEPELIEDLKRLESGLDALTGLGETIAPEYWDLRMEYVGPGYGVPSHEGNEAIRYLAQREGVFLDPIYSGKAFAGLIDLAKKRQVKNRVLFWHTGGAPTLFAYPYEVYR